MIEGTITRIVNYGAFVEIEPGVEGLLHTSRLSRAGDVEDPRTVVQQGERHLLRIVNISGSRQRIALSLKAVTPEEQMDWMTTQAERAADEAEAAAAKAADEEE